MHTITACWHPNADTIIVDLIDQSDNTNRGSFKWNSFDIFPRMVELLTAYEINPKVHPKVLQVLDPALYASLEHHKSLQAADYKIDVDAAGEDRVCVGYKSGDTGYVTFGHGTSYMAAVADLARNHGYKFREGYTILDFFEDFKYGLERKSAEQLQAEMDALYAPEKGAW